MDRVLAALTDRVSRSLDVAQSEIHGRSIVIDNPDETPVINVLLIECKILGLDSYTSGEYAATFSLFRRSRLRSLLHKLSWTETRSASTSGRDSGGHERVDVSVVPISSVPEATLRATTDGHANLRQRARPADEKLKVFMSRPQLRNEQS